MTNQEYIIRALQNEFDDAGSTLESVLYYNIECPYFSIDERALCFNDYKKIGRDTCVECKSRWLSEEVDE